MHKNHRKMSNQNTLLKLFPFQNCLGSFCPCGRGVQTFPSDNQPGNPRTQMRERQLAPTVVNFNSTMDACAKGASPQSLEADLIEEQPNPPGTENVHEMQPKKREDSKGHVTFPIIEFEGDILVL